MMGYGDTWGVTVTEKKMETYLKLEKRQTLIYALIIICILFAIGYWATHIQFWKRNTN
jgi:hypothetical protein